MCLSFYLFIYFFFNDSATTEIYTLSRHDALPIWRPNAVSGSIDGASASSAAGSGKVSAAKTSSLLNISLDLCVAGMSAVGRSTPGERRMSDRGIRDRRSPILPSPAGGGCGSEDALARAISPWQIHQPQSPSAQLDVSKLLSLNRAGNRIFLIFQRPAESRQGEAFLDFSNTTERPPQPRQNLSAIVTKRSPQRPYND